VTTVNREPNQQQNCVNGPEKGAGHSSATQPLARGRNEPTIARSHRSLILTTVVPVAALALLATGCGGRGSPGVASIASATTPGTTTTQNNTQTALIAFSTCMRAHGVANFPDPQRFAGGNLKLTIHQLSPSQGALKACSHLLPTTGGSASPQTAQQERTQRADGLSFARCMRHHGVSRFPDPTAQGQLTIEMVEAEGIDVHSPAVLRVVQACLPASHGALTPAKVREALNKASG